MNVETDLNDRDMFTSFRHFDKGRLQFVTKDKIIKNQNIRIEERYSLTAEFTLNRGE